jgi:predicted NUDIX family NTP pyrophosphohydrolase
VGYALEGEFDVSAVHSNEIAIEWPPRNGRTESFPEVDRAAWSSLSQIIAGQLPFLDRSKCSAIVDLALNRSEHQNAPRSIAGQEPRICATSLSSINSSC